MSVTTTHLCDCSGPALAHESLAMSSVSAKKPSRSVSTCRALRELCGDLLVSSEPTEDNPRLACIGSLRKIAGKLAGSLRCEEERQCQTLRDVSS